MKILAALILCSVCVAAMAQTKRPSDVLDVKMREIHLKLSKLDVDQAKQLMEYKHKQFTKTQELATKLPGREVTQAKFEYEQAQIEYQRKLLLTELSEETGQYYGF